MQAIKLGLSSFYTLCPNNVRHHTMSTYITCVCVVCEVTRQLVAAARIMRRQYIRSAAPPPPPADALDILNTDGLRGFVEQLSPFTCGCCDAATDTGDGAAEAEPYFPHKLPCMLGTCPDCRGSSCGPPRNLYLYEDEVDGEWGVSFPLYQKAPHPTDPSKQQQWGLSTVTMPAAEVCSRLVAQLLAYIPHRFTSSWQKLQFEQALKHLQPGDLLLVMDFSMNVEIPHNRQLQPEWWKGLPYVSLLMFITYQVVDGVVEKVVHAAFSQVTQHSAAYVMAALKHVLTSCGVKAGSCVHVFSDGCAGQFRSRFTTAGLRRLAQMLGIWIARHYSEAGHGKGDIDGQSAPIKETVRADCMQDQSVVRDHAAGHATGCAELVNQRLGQPMQHPSRARQEQRQLTRRVAFVVTTHQVEAEEKFPNAAPVAGMREVHAMRFSPDGHVQTATRSCCCSSCMGAGGSVCQGAEWKGLWREHDCEGRMGAAAEEEEEEVDVLSNLGQLLSAQRFTWVALLPAASASPACSSSASVDGQPCYVLAQLADHAELLSSRHGRPPHVNGTGAPSVHGRVVFKARVVVEVGPDGAAAGVELPEQPRTLPWFDDTVVAAVGVAVQLEQRSGGGNAAQSRRGPKRAAKDPSNAPTSRTFIMLSPQDHDEVLDAVVALQLGL